MVSWSWESIADNLYFLLRGNNLCLISTLDSMAASHILEGRSRTVRASHIYFIGPKQAGRIVSHEQVCHGAKKSRNLKNLRKEDIPLKGLKIPKFQWTTLSGMMHTARWVPFMRFCDSQGKGGQKSKDSPLPGTVSSPWFSACCDNSTGFMFYSSQCQHQHCIKDVLSPKQLPHVLFWEHNLI